jgi:hypothetical protein
VTSCKHPERRSQERRSAGATSRGHDRCLNDAPETQCRRKCANEKAESRGRLARKKATEAGHQVRAKKGEKVPLLSGGNPQIAKAEGDAPVQAYIAAMPDWKRDVGKRLDTLIVRTVPKVQKAVKWNSPFYGIEGQGSFLSFHVFTRYVKVTFFRGTSLRPVPAGGTPKSKETRWIDIHEDDLDETQMAAWVKQVAALPGWVPGQSF